MTHPLGHNEARRALVREADVVLLLEVAIRRASSTRSRIRTRTRASWPQGTCAS
jgi:hypothetical protein